jgi:hypothetical protein
MEGLMDIRERESYVSMVQSIPGSEGGIPRSLIVRALARIEAGREDVACYPSGLPSLRGVLDVAIRLHAHAVANK